MLSDARERTRLTVSILANGIGEAFKSIYRYDEDVEIVLMEANRLLPVAILDAREADAAYMDTFGNRRLRRTRVSIRARTRKNPKPRMKARKSANGQKKQV